MSKRPPLDEIRNTLGSGATRTRKAKRIANEIRLAGDYYWVGIYQLEAEEIAILGLEGSRSALASALSGDIGALRCGCGVAKRGRRR